MQCDMMQGERYGTHEERKTYGSLDLIRSLNEDHDVQLLCTSFELCLWEHVLFVWMITTNANDALFSVCPASFF